MSKTKFDELAFPNECTEGMSLRDYFAGQALAGILANSEYLDFKHRAASTAYQYADAMLAERSKGGSK